jgi:hypothetical protein
METVESVLYQLTERRIAQLTLVVGTVAAAGACLLFSMRIGAGVLAGSVLAWLNFRWLAEALDVLVQVSTATEETTKGRVPLGSIFRLIGRYALIAIIVYVIFWLFKVPVLSMLVGLCALGAATIGASLYEILRPVGS